MAGSQSDRANGSGSRRGGKSKAAFRTISEVADELDVAQHVLRFWETKFHQISPLKRGGGRRYYRPEDIEFLRQIKRLLYTEGYTIKGVQKLLREIGSKTITESGRSLSGNSAGGAASVAAGRTRRESGAAVRAQQPPEDTLPLGSQGELDVNAMAGTGGTEAGTSGLSANQRGKLQELAAELGELRNILRQPKN